MPTVENEMIPINHPGIDPYLKPNVDPVRLPVKFGDDETYPTLVLDGASGVGC